MGISFNCPHCGVETLVTDQYAGQTGPCRSCGATITVPGEPSAGGVAPAPSKNSSSRVVITVVLAVSCLLICPCGGVLVALLLPAVQSAREAILAGV